MQKCFVWAPAIFFAGAVLAQDGRPDPRDAKAKAPPVEYRSALEGYRSYADAEQRDWRKANAEVAAAAQKSKPQPASSEASGHGGHR